MREGRKETIEDGKTGILVNDVEELGNAMREVAENPSLANDLGRNGRERVAKHYSWSVFFKGFDKALKDVKKGQEDRR